jgi:hypothetical protein
VSKQQQSPETRQPWYGRTLAAAALALILTPASVLATATYDGGAFFEFTNVSAPDTVLLLFSVDDDETNASASGISTTSATANPALNDDTDLAGITPNDVRVTGSADPTLGGSVSSADATSIVSVFAQNLSPTGGTADVIFDFIYGADVMTGVTGLLESAFVDVTLLMDTVLGGPGEPGGSIVNESLSAISTDPNDPTDSDVLFGQGSFTLTLQPGELNGVQVVLTALGQAVSAAEAPVPVPATLALLGLGLLGVGARRKRLHVRA